MSAAELLDALEQPMHAAAPSPYAEEAEISKRRQHRSARRLNMTAANTVFDGFSWQETYGMTERHMYDAVLHQHISHRDASLLQQTFHSDNRTYLITVCPS